MEIKGKTTKLKANSVEYNASSKALNLLTTGNYIKDVKCRHCKYVKIHYPDSEILIQMVPEGFFYDTARKIISIFIGSMGVSGALGYISLQKKKA